jgi:hypothetical protein
MKCCGLKLPKEIEMEFLPGRQVVTRAPHRRVGYISCPWFQGEQIAYESLLEQGFVHIALLCPGVRAIQAQPFKLPLEGGAHYTPDYLLTFEDQRHLVVEIKPSPYVPQHRSKLSEAAQMLRSSGYGFLICTEEQIQTGDRHRRASLILRHARSHGAGEHLATVREIIPKLAFPTSVSQIARLTALEPHHVCGAIGRGALRLRPDLGLDAVYSHDYLRDDDHELLQHTAWLNAQDW